MAVNKFNLLLASPARIQIPYVKVTIGEFTFGAFNKETRKENNQGFYKSIDIQYPNYIQSLQVTKINGKVNQYRLTFIYPVTQNNDPNFFEKIFSKTSTTRKIIFTYGDCSMPNYMYKNEEAIITGIQQTFDFNSSTITYNVSATSSSALGLTTVDTFIVNGPKKPSDEIKRIFKDSKYNLQSLFTGMTANNLDKLIAGDDKAVNIPAKTNVSVLDYLGFLVNCMIPVSAKQNDLSDEMYILTIHDNTTYDSVFNSESYIDTTITGPYFKVGKVSSKQNQSDAFIVDIGYNTSTIVTNFSIENNENYSIYYDYQKEIHPQIYTRRINDKGLYEDVYAPMPTSNNDKYLTNADDITWWTKITKYPINATITLQGLLRPAMLMSYIRLNIVFPGGHKYIGSGLYIVTKQVDTLDYNGYRTQLSLTKIEGAPIN